MWNWKYNYLLQSFITWNYDVVHNDDDHDNVSSISVITQQPRHDYVIITI